MRRADLKTSKILSEGDGKSKRERYQELIIGETGWGAFIKYELILLLCSWLPGVLGLFLRSKLYPLILGSVGRNVIFGSNVVLRHPGKIHIGDNVVVDDNCMLDAKGVDNDGIRLGNGVFLGRNTILSCKDGNITLEDRVNVGFNSEIYSSSDVWVGENTMIAAYCYLIGGGNYDLDSDVPFGVQDGLQSRGITIGQGNWLAADVKVLDGVTTGQNCIIGAGAVVRADLPPDAIAVGVPAKVIRERN